MFGIHHRNLEEAFDMIQKEKESSKVRREKKIEISPVGFRNNKTELEIKKDLIAFESQTL